MAFVELPFHPMATMASNIYQLATSCFDVGEYQQMEVELKVVSAYTHPMSPPGQLDVQLQHSMDLEAWHYLTPSFTPVQLVQQQSSQEQLSFSRFLRYVRAQISMHGDEVEGPLIATFSLLGIARNGL